jgi:integrase
MPAQKRTESWKGIEFTYSGRRIVKARFKRGYPQKWHMVPRRYYGSKQECLVFKEGEKLTISPTVVPNSKITFGAYIERFLDRQSVKVGTTRSYDYRLRSDAIKPLHSKRLVQIEREHILALVKRMKRLAEDKGRTLPLSTLRANLTPVQALFTHAIREGDYRGVNPVSAIKLPELARPLPKKKVEVYSEEDLARLFEALDAKHYGLFGLAYYTGARISELLGLRWENIHDDHPDPLDNYVHFEGQRDPLTGDWLPYTKNEREGEADGREVDLPPEALRFVKAQRVLCGINRRPKDPVFPELTQHGVSAYIRGETKRGRRYPGLRERLGRPFDGTDGLKPFTMHKLRHTYGSTIVARGGDTEEARAQMGITARVFEKTYQHQIRRSKRDRTRMAGHLMNRPIQVVGT